MLTFESSKAKIERKTVEHTQNVKNNVDGINDIDKNIGLKTTSLFLFALR